MKSSPTPLLGRAWRWVLAVIGVCVVGGVFGALSGLGTPTASAADNTLVTSNPAEGTTAPTSPTSLSLTFAGPVGASDVVAVVCNGTAVDVGVPKVGADRITLAVAVPSPLPKGSCVTTWKVTQTDGTPGGTGSFAFTVAAGTTTTVAGAPATDAPPADAATSTRPGASSASGGSSSKGPLGVARLFATMSIAVLFGALVLIALAWPEGVEYILTVRFLRMTYYLALATTVLFVICLRAQLTGGSIGASISPATWKDLTDHGPGVAALVRLVFVAGCGWVVLRPERVIDPATHLAALAIPGVALATLGFSRPLGQLAAVGALAGIVHALAMAVWFGGLVLLTRVVLAGPGDADLVHAVRGFSRIANPALIATVASGLVQTWRLDRGALFDTGHGYVLLMKTLVVAAMVFIGVATRQFVRQRMQRAETMPAALATRLRRAIGIEALAGVLVLVLTAWLLGLAPGNPDAEGAAPSRPKDLRAPVAIVSDTLGVRINIAFTQVVGPNAVRVDVLKVPLPYDGMTVTFTAPADSGAADVELAVPLKCTACAAQLPLSSGLPLGAAGVWKVTVVINKVEIGSKNVTVTAGTAAGTTTASTSRSTG